MKNKLIQLLSYLLSKLNTTPTKIKFGSKVDVSVKCKLILQRVSERFNLTKEEESKLFVAGGSIRSLILGEDVKDYDIFLTDNTLVEKFRNTSMGFVSDNAISFYVDRTQVQIITTTTGQPMDIVNQFDFVMNQNYYYPYAFFNQDVLYIKDEETILTKSLKVNMNCRNKLGTLARINKFAERGYKVPSKTDLLGLGIALTKLPEVKTLTNLKEESKLYLSSDDCYELMDNQSIEMASYSEVLSFTGNRGSGL